MHYKLSGCDIRGPPSLEQQKSIGFLMYDSNLGNTIENYRLSLCHFIDLESHYFFGKRQSHGKPCILLNQSYLQVLN